MDPPTEILLKQFQQGDSCAAEMIFERYLERLTRLARSRISPRFFSRFDEEDVVLSAFRSFFLGARKGQFSIRRSGDLWRLLVKMTLHKLYRNLARHTASKRAVEFEETVGVDGELVSWCVSHDPTPDEAAAFAENLELVMAKFSTEQRIAFELRLQGEKLEEIAKEMQVSERTVRRILVSIRESLQEWNRER